MFEIILSIIIGLIFYCVGQQIFKFMEHFKYDLNDYTILEYPNGDEIKLYKNTETGIYEEVNNI